MNTRVRSALRFWLKSWNIYYKMYFLIKESTHTQIKATLFPRGCGLEDLYHI